MNSDLEQSDEAVVFERHDDVVVVRLNSPATRNALEPRVKKRIGMNKAKVAIARKIA